MKKTLLSLGSLAAIAAPVGIALACGTEAQEVAPFQSGRVNTKYVSGLDILTSLRLPVYSYTRSDISTSSDIKNEKYLADFIKSDIKHLPSTFTKWDKEDFIKYDLDAIVSNPFNDTKGILDTLRNKIDYKNEDFIKDINDPLRWRDETKKIAQYLDKMSNPNKGEFTARANKIVDEWDKREIELRKDTKKMIKKPMSVLFLTGTYQNDTMNFIINSAISPERAHEVYMLPNIQFPKYDEKLVKGFVSGNGNIYKYGGVSSTKKPTAASVKELTDAFAGKVDKIIYLKPPHVANKDIPLGKTEDEIKNFIAPMLTSTSNKDKKIIKDYAIKLGVNDLYKKEYSDLSGGQQQRVLIAMCLIQETDIIILDEPTNHLDLKYQIEIFEILEKLKKTKLLIITSHQINLVSKFSDYILMLKNGQVIEFGDSKIINQKNMKKLLSVDVIISNVKGKAHIVDFNSIKMKGKNE